MDNIEELKQYTRQVAKTYISGREDDIEDLEGEVLLRVAALPQALEGEERWKRIASIVLTVVLEFRHSLKGEHERPLCDSGQVDPLRATLPEDSSKDDPPTNEDEKEDEPLHRQSQLGRIEVEMASTPEREDEERRRKRRAFFLDRLRELSPSVEAVERRGTTEDRLLLRVLRKIREGEMEVEEALGVLLRMKDRDWRAAMFQALADAYERHQFTPAEPVTCYPPCGMSEEPTILRPGSPGFEKTQTTGRRVFGLTQGELGEVFGFQASEASLLKREEPDAQLELEAKRLEERAKAEIEKREKETLERLERVLRKSPGKPKNPGPIDTEGEKDVGDTDSE